MDEAQGVKRKAADIVEEQRQKRQKREELDNQIHVILREENDLQYELERSPDYHLWLKEQRLAALKKYLGDDFFQLWVERHNLSAISVTKIREKDISSDKNMTCMYRLSFLGDSKDYRFGFDQATVFDEPPEEVRYLTVGDANDDILLDTPRLWEKVLQLQEPNLHDDHTRVANAIFATLLLLRVGMTHLYPQPTMAQELEWVRSNYIRRQKERKLDEQKELLKEELRALQLNRNLLDAHKWIEIILCQF